MLHHQVELSSFIQLSPSFSFFFSLLLSFLFFFFLVANYLQSGFGGAEPMCVNQAWEDHLSVRGQQTALWAWGFQEASPKVAWTWATKHCCHPCNTPMVATGGIFQETFFACGAQVHSTPSEVQAPKSSRNFNALNYTVFIISMIYCRVFFLSPWGISPFFLYPPPVLQTSTQGCSSQTMGGEKVLEKSVKKRRGGAKRRA